MSSGYRFQDATVVTESADSILDVLEQRNSDTTYCKRDCDGSIGVPVPHSERSSTDSGVAVRQ